MVLGSPRAQGSSSLLRGDLTLEANGTPTSSFGPFFAGQGERPAGTPLGTSQGNLCPAGTLRRFPVVMANSNGRAQMPLDLVGSGSFSTAPMVGDALYFQYWYRDLGSSSNATAGMRLCVTP